MYNSSIYFLLSYIFIFSQLGRVVCHRRGGGHHEQYQQDFVPAGRSSSRGGRERGGGGGGGHGESRTRLIDVDVKVKQDTNDSIYEYFADAQYERFSARSGNLIRNVLKNGNVIEQAKNKNYYDRVVIFVNQNGEKKIKFLTPGEDDPDDPAKRRSSGRSSGRSQQADRGRRPSQPSSNVQYVKLNLKQKESTDGIDYMFYERENIHRFVCKEGYLIRKVCKNDKVLWEYPTTDYLNRVLIKPDHSGNPILSLLCPCDVDNDEPTYDPRGGRVSRAAAPSRGTAHAPQAGRPQLVDVDVKVKQSTNEVSYELNQDTGCETFAARPGYLFRAVLKNGKVMEEPRDKQYYDRVVIYKDQRGDRKIKFLKPGEIDMDNVQFIKVDLTHKGSTNQVLYRKDTKTGMEKFKCRPGFLIRKVLKGEKVIAECPRGENYDRAVISVGKDGKKKLDFFFPGDIDPLDPDETFLTLTEQVQSDIEMFSEAEDDQRGRGRGRGRAQEAKPQAMAPEGRRGRRESVFEPPQRSVVIEDSAAEESGAEDFAAKESGGEGFDDDGAGRQPVPLELSKQRSSNSHNYKKSGYIHIFTVKKGFGFAQISLNGKNIWQSKKLAKRVDYSFNTFTFVHDLKLKLFDDTLKKYTKHNKKDWEEAEAIEINPVEVDIKATRDTDQYRSDSHGPDRIFFPHPGWAFDRIKESGRLGSSGVQIWSTNEPTEYVNKIVRDGAGFGKSITKMTCFLINGLEKHFTKSNGEWIEEKKESNDD